MVDVKEKSFPELVTQPISELEAASEDLLDTDKLVYSESDATSSGARSGAFTDDDFKDDEFKDALDEIQELGNEFGIPVHLEQWLT